MIVLCLKGPFKRDNAQIKAEELSHLMFFLFADKLCRLLYSLYHIYAVIIWIFCLLFCCTKYTRVL